MTQWRHRFGIAALAAVPLLVLAVFFVYPVAGMIGRGVMPQGRLDLGALAEVLTRPRTLRVIWFTAWSALAATALSVMLGLPCAFVLHRLRFPGRSLLRAVVMVPFVLPTVVVGVAFTQTLGEGSALGFLGLQGSALAIVLALAYFNVAVVVRTVGTFWEALDPRREEAAAALGASPRQVFTTVTLPALLPSIAAAASVVFLFCSTSFGVVLTMGGLRYANIETEIYLLTTQELDLAGAAALSVLQVLTITTMLLILQRARRTTAPSRRTPNAGRGWRRGDIGVGAAAAVTLLFLTWPLVSLVTASLRRGERWTLDNFRGLSARTDTLVVTGWQAAVTSLSTAATAAFVAVSLGVAVSIVVTRRARGPIARRLLGGVDAAFMLPLGVSAVTLGFGFMITLNRPPVDLRTSWVLVPLAQALVALPLVVRTVAPVLASIDDRQRQAAASLGASALRVFATVDLAAAWRAVLAATGFAFAVSLGEFGATSFVVREDSPTLPVLIYRLLGVPGAEPFGLAMAAAVVLAVTSAVVMIIVERLRVGSMGAF